MSDTPRPGDEHTRNVSEMFGRMTPWYDLQNRVFSLFLDCWWRHNLVRSVVPGPTNTVIDMAAGTLDVSLALVRRYPSLRVYATDICEPMLRYGEERKMRANERSRVTTMVADARNMPLPDGCADAVTIAFGIRNFEHLDKGLQEMCRVLRPGGHLVILELSTPNRFPMKQLYRLYSKCVIPLIGRTVSHDDSAYTYLPASIRALLLIAFFWERYIRIWLGSSNSLMSKSKSSVESTSSVSDRPRIRSRKAT